MAVMPSRLFLLGAEDTVVAEAIPAETEVTPAEEVAVVTPDSQPEATPAPENVEETSAVDDILGSIETASAANASDNGTNATPDEVVPPAAEPALTPEQIRQEERARVAAENRINGLKWVVTQDSPAKLAALEAELSDAGREILRTELNRIKGAFDPLLQRAVDVDTNVLPQVHTQGWNAAVTKASEEAWAVAEKEFGAETVKKMQAANPSTWGALFEVGIKEARKGYVPAADYVSKASTKEHLAKLETALAERAAQGIVTRSLKDLTGDKSPSVPAIRGGSTSSDDAKLLDPNTPIHEIEAIRARQRRAGG